MSGNVRELRWDLYENNTTKDCQGRVWSSGGWIGDDFCCQMFSQGSWVANSKGSNTDFRLYRGK